MPSRRINEIVLEKRAVTANTDLRLARYFGVSEGSFSGLQIDCELLQERRKIGAALDAIMPPRRLIQLTPPSRETSTSR